jgi:hypothetical protein
MAAKSFFVAALAVGASTFVTPALGEGEPVDRVVVVFEAPETGGALAPQVIFERELAFEALVDEDGAYAERHVRGALDRHVATELLAHLPVEKDARVVLDPCDTKVADPDATDLEHRTLLARQVLANRVHGLDDLYAAAEAEQLSEAELARLLRREAMAARYLDLMVTPMLAPSDAELRDILRSTPTPYRGQHFEEVRCELRRFVIGQRLGAALTSFLQSSKSRVRMRRVRR